MDIKLKRVFVALVLLQVVHSIEEYAFKFYRIFPPARRLGDLIPGISRSGFIIFNVLLVCFGLVSFAYWVRPARLGARPAICFWIVTELYNGIAHLVWAIAVQGYNPGLVSAAALLGLAAYLAYRVRQTVWLEAHLK